MMCLDTRVVEMESSVGGASDEMSTGRERHPIRRGRTSDDCHLDDWHLDHGLRVTLR
jgi:hypothetical protein